MKLQSFEIFARDCGDYYVFTTIFGPTGTVAECDPVHFADFEELQSGLSSLIETRLAASHSKSDITGDEESSDAFLKTIKAKTWNAFYRDCVSVRINRDSDGYDICVGHWDGRGFYSSREDRIELPASSNTVEVAEHLVKVLKSLRED